MPAWPITYSVHARDGASDIAKFFLVYAQLHLNIPEANYSSDAVISPCHSGILSSAPLFPTTPSDAHIDLLLCDILLRAIVPSFTIRHVYKSKPFCGILPCVTVVSPSITATFQLGCSAKSNEMAEYLNRS